MPLEDLIARMKKQIGFSDEPVQDADGYWTIGYGQRLNDAPGGPKPWATMSEPMAADVLRERIKLGDFEANPEQNFSGGLQFAANSANPSTNPPHVDEFFNTQNDRISQLAKEMNTSESGLLGLAAGESNWGRPQGMNNLFGFSKSEKQLDYASPDDAIDAFRHSQWYDRLRDKTDADSFISELLNTHDGTQPKYNSVNEKYDEFLRGMVGTVDRRRPIWDQSR